MIRASAATETESLTISKTSWKSGYARVQITYMSNLIRNTILEFNINMSFVVST